MKYNDTMISSNPPEEVKRVVNRSRPRLVLGVDNLRLVGMLLPKDHELYSPDTYEIIAVSLVDEHHTRESKRLLTCLSPLLEGKSKAEIVDLRYGTYKLLN